MSISCRAMPLDIRAKILRESCCLMIKYPRSSILCAVLTLLLWNAAATPAQADTGTLRVVFGKVGLVAAVGSGEGVLTFQGKRYGFLVAGASIGPTLALSTNVLHGTAPGFFDLSQLTALLPRLDCSPALGIGSIRYAIP